MPKVTQYQANQVQTRVTNDPLASSASADAVFQANTQLSQAGGNVGQAVADMTLRIDTTSAEEAMVAFERDKNNLFFEPETGYFNTQGKNAFDSAGAASKSLNDIKKQYGDTLNSSARAMFDGVADTHISKSQVDITRHSAKGMKAWEVATINAQVENTLESAALIWNQPETLNVQNALGRQAVIDSAEKEGIGAEATNEKLQTYDSAFASTAISAAISSSAAEGKELLDKHGSKLEGTSRVKMENMLAKRVKTEKIQIDSQRAVLSGAALADAYEDRSAIRDEVNKIDDADLRGKTMKEAMRQFDIKRKAESEEQKASFEDAESHIFDGGSAETFQAQDPEGWDKLSAKQKGNIESGKSTATDWNAFSDLMVLPKAQLRDINPTDHFHQLAPAERAKLVSAVRSATGSGSGADKIDHQNGRTRSSQTSSAMEQLLGKKSTWNDDERAQANSFYDLLDGEVASLEQQKGSSLTSSEYTDMLSKLTREVTIKRNAFGIDFLAPDSDQDITDITPDNLKQLSDFLRENNIPVTAESLLKAQQQADI